VTTYLCDVNVWLALSISAHTHHAGAVGWLDGLSEPGTVVFCRTTQQAFLRLLTNPAVLGAYGNPPLTNAEAWTVHDALFADERITLQDREPTGVQARWRSYAARDSVSPKLWTDAWLAAFAATGRHRLVTIDTAFAQFPGLDLLTLTV
jgi:hypothetical protein